MENDFKELREAIENGDLDSYYGNEEDTFWLGVEYGKYLQKKKDKE